MATISLGKTPKNFKKIVKVPMLDGSEGTIECVFKYRTMVEYGTLVDSLSADTGVQKDPVTGEISMEDVFKGTSGKNGEYLTKILDGWNLDVEFSTEAAQQLCNELPGAANAVMSTYRAAIVEGRLGN